jgi:hypothetical protein
MHTYSPTCLCSRYSSFACLLPLLVFWLSFHLQATCILSSSAIICAYFLVNSSLLILTYLLLNFHHTFQFFTRKVFIKFNIYDDPLFGNVQVAKFNYRTIFPLKNHATSFHLRKLIIIFITNIYFIKIMIRIIETFNNN